MFCILGCIDNLANRIDHELRLLVVDVVAAVGFRDVLRVRHELREILLRRLLRGIDDVPKVRPKCFLQLTMAFSDSSGGLPPLGGLPRRGIRCLYAVPREAG